MPPLKPIAIGYGDTRMAKALSADARAGWLVLHTQGLCVTDLGMSCEYSIVLLRYICIRINLFEYFEIIQTPVYSDSHIHSGLQQRR